MNLETIFDFPDGKTELPATVIVNKLRDDIQIDWRLHIKLPKRIKEVFVPEEKE